MSQNLSFFNHLAVCLLTGMALGCTESQSTAQAADESPEKNQSAAKSGAGKQSKSVELSDTAEEAPQSIQQAISWLMDEKKSIAAERYLDQQGEKAIGPLVQHYLHCARTMQPFSAALWKEILTLQLMKTPDKAIQYLKLKRNRLNASQEMVMRGNAVNAALANAALQADPRLRGVRQKVASPQNLIEDEVRCKFLMNELIRRSQLKEAHGK